MWNRNNNKKKICFDGIHWVHLVQGGKQWQALVNTAGFYKSVFQVIRPVKAANSLEV